MEKSGDGSSNLQLQIATLKRALVALSAQKSQMEASFKADNKQIRTELLLRDKTISELQENMLELNKKHVVDLEAMRSQVIECQKREKDSGLKYLELTTEQDAGAFVTEQGQAHTPEERSNLAVMHEDRVASLEARLAELSITVETHDRLRQQDQKSIQKLKDKIDAKEKTKTSVPEIVDEIMQLKKLLIIENAKSNNPVDINKIFITDAVHNQCVKDKNKLQADLNACKSENSDLIKFGKFQQKNIETLQAEVKVLNKSVKDKQKLRADLNACKSENSDLLELAEVLQYNIKTLQEEVKVLKQSVNDNKKLRADLNACQFENSNLKKKVANQKENLKILNAKFQI